MKNAFSGHFHHAAGKGDPGHDAEAGNDHDDFIRRHFGTDGGIQKIDRIIGYPHNEIQNSKQEQQAHCIKEYFSSHGCFSLSLRDKR